MTPFEPCDDCGHPLPDRDAIPVTWAAMSSGWICAACYEAGGYVCGWNAPPFAAENLGYFARTYGAYPYEEAMR